MLLRLQAGRSGPAFAFAADRTDYAVFSLVRPECNKLTNVVQEGISPGSDCLWAKWGGFVPHIYQ